MGVLSCISLSLFGVLFLLLIVDCVCGTVSRKRHEEAYLKAQRDAFDYMVKSNVKAED